MEQAIEYPGQGCHLKCHISREVPQCPAVRIYVKMIGVSVKSRPVGILCHVDGCKSKYRNNQHVHIKEPSSPALFHVEKWHVTIKAYMFLWCCGAVNFSIAAPPAVLK